MRRLLFLAVVALMSMPAGVRALSLGNLELRSALHQPLNARIPILSATGDEIETLNVRIASAEQFERAGVGYSALLTQLRFDIEETRKGPDYIVITSRNPVSEPYLNFLVEVNWARGRLIREFTALLDPPLYDPNRRIAWNPAQVSRSAAPAPQAAVAVAPRPGSPARATTGETWRSTDQQVYRYDAARARPASRVARPADGSYPTLWSAARAMRPGPAVSMHQMMIALLRANPDAFIRGNINLLKKGYVLKMPDKGALNALAREEALAEVNRHHALWQEYRQRGAVAAPTQPTGAAVAVTAPHGDSGVAVTPPEPANEDKLKLLGAKESGGAGAAGGASGTGSSEDLALARERVASRERENEDLRAQLTESEQIIENLRTRIALQDDQLADLQHKLAAAGGAAAPETVAPTSSETAPTPFEDDDPESWRRLDQKVYTLAEPPSAPDDATAPPATPAEITPESWRSLEYEILTDIAPPPPPPEPDIDETLAGSEPPATVPDPSGTGAEPPGDTSGTSSTADTPSAAPSDVAPTATAGDTPQAESVSEAEPVAESDPSPAEAAPPADEKGLITTLMERASGVVPAALAESIPGGIFTLLGVLLAVLAAIVLVIARRRAEPAPPSVPMVADADLGIDVPPAARDRIMSVDAALEEPLAGGADLFTTQETIHMTALPGGAKPAAVGEAEDDPLAEVNVYLAYERFDEAERLIREAIAKYPNEHKYKLRLLEVYYSSNNKPAYETAARSLQAAVGGIGPLWDTALAMWREISPTRDLFAAASASEAVADAPSRQFVDITAMDERMSRTVTSAQESAGPIAFDLEPEPAEMRAEEPAGLDFDLGTQEKSALDLLDITAPANGGEQADEIFDIAAERGGAVEDLLDMSVPSAMEGASPAVNELLSLTKSGTAQGDSALSTLADPEGILADTDFDVTGGEPDILKAELAAETLVEFDLGGAGDGAGQFGPANVVDFPVREDALAEPVSPPESLTTLVDIAPTAAEATAMEFDIGGLDLAAEIEQPPLPEVADIDAISLDANTIRVFEGDPTAMGGDVTSPGLTGSETAGAATANDLDLTADLFNLDADTGVPRYESMLDELSADGETLDDITKSLADTMGMKDEAEMPTVDLTLDAGVISEMDAAAGFFPDDLQPASGTETVGLTDVQFPDGQSTTDEVDTKLNLAKAYIELGDAAGARSILDEVVSAGSEGQREEAQRLLRELTT